MQQDKRTDGHCYLYKQVAGAGFEGPRWGREKMLQKKKKNNPKTNKQTNRESEYRGPSNRRSYGTRRLHVPIDYIYM